MNKNKEEMDKLWEEFKNMPTPEFNEWNLINDIVSYEKAEGIVYGKSRNKIKLDRF